MRGEEFQPIQKNVSYQRFENVNITKWGETSSDTKQWCESIWKEAFGTTRTPLNNEDLVGWIPHKGTIVSRYGYWIGESKSRNVIYVNFLYVSPECRGDGVARQLILSMCNESTKLWGASTPFMFEVDEIPKSLVDIDAQPMCRYSYVWVPFNKLHKSRQWRKRSTKHISLLKGFHGKHTGFRLYQNAIGDKILFDCNDDIVWFTNMFSLTTFDRHTKDGAYCRIFTPFGKSAVFAENMYFTPSYTSHYILG